MRAAIVLSLLCLLPLAACAKADAATIDPNDDFDCAVTSGFFREFAKLDPNAPDKGRQGLYILNGYFAAKWDDEHPAGKDEALRNHERAMVNAMAKDIFSYRETLMACMTRVEKDPKFNKFAELVKQRTPEAR